MRRRPRSILGPVHDLGRIARESGSRPLAVGAHTPEWRAHSDPASKTGAAALMRAERKHVGGEDIMAARAITPPRIMSMTPWLALIRLVAVGAGGGAPPP